MAKGDRNRFILTELHKDERIIKITFIILSIILIGNVIYLAKMSTFIQPKISKPTEASSSDIKISPSPTETITTAPTAATPSSAPIIIYKEGVPAIKDYYIPFGGGSNQTDDWADVAGLQANVDFGNYKNIKEVRFEVSVNIPTGNQTASVRLFNDTDKHPVWYSEVTTTNNAYTISSPIIYDTGMKNYKVQMKTQLKYLANLTQSRIHIILK